MLVALSPDARTTRVGSAVFVASALLLFGVSAAYHRGTWSPRTWYVLRRLDHCNIFVLIAGSCTAYALLLLDARGQRHDAGHRVVQRPGGRHRPVRLARCAPVALTTDLRRLRLGSAALPSRASWTGRRGSATSAPPPSMLLAAGGALYVAGAVVYGFQRPDPWPRWFGFHEVFHAFTVLAFASHYVGISLATYAAR